MTTTKNKSINMRPPSTDGAAAPADAAVDLPKAASNAARAVGCIVAGTGAVAGPIAGDMLYGAEAIALFLFGDAKHRRRVYNLEQFPIGRN